MTWFAQRSALCCLAALLFACGDEAAADPEIVGAAGAAPTGCQAGEVERDGGCDPAGVLPEMCAAGFEYDDAGGCTPLLPSATCPPGQMAVMGETECREVAPCGAAPWGDVPVDGDTQHVDASFGGASDGSPTQPWTTIGQGVAAATPGAIIAIAAGNYSESLDITKPVRLWGRCPSLVTITGVDSGGAAAFLRAAADGAEVRDLALTGAGLGLAVLGADAVVADRLWIHDTASWGMVAGLDGPAAVTLSRSLIEGATELGIHNSAAHVTVEGSVVRGTRERAGLQGRGINAESHSTSLERAVLDVRGSLVEDNRDIGIFVGGSDAIIDASVVRGTRMSSGGEDGGVGVHARQDAGELNRGNIQLRSSVIEFNADAGVSARASDISVQGSVVRNTLPSASDGTAGFGLRVDSSTTGTQRGVATIEHALFEQNRSCGVVIVGADATLLGVAVRGTQPQEATGAYGRGATVQFEFDTPHRAAVTIRGSSFHDNHEAGIVLVSSDLEVIGTSVRNTASSPTLLDFGDGILAVSQGGGPTSLIVRSSLVDSSARAGVAALGASAYLEQSVLSCNPIQLTASDFDGFSFSFDDGGGNSCSCADDAANCTVLTTSLQPPAAL